MELISVNISGKTRREKLHGEDYVVAPLRMLVEGVLAGSQGKLFYPAAEIARDPAAWNAMPITNRHPTLNGVNVSARRPDILEAQWLGNVFAAKADGPLDAEGWFNVKATRRLAPQVLNAIEAGQPVELSTGLFLDQEATPGVHNGRNYDRVAKNYRPDHLAILPDATGACSIADGCGVLVNEESRGIVERFFGWLGGVVKPPVVADWVLPVHEIEFTKLSSGGTNNEEEPDMKLTPEQKAATIKHLTANCDCWRGEEATLNGFSDDKLAALKAHADTERARADALASVQTKYGVDLLVANADEALMAKCKELMAEKPAANVQSPPTEKKEVTEADLFRISPRLKALAANLESFDRQLRGVLLERLTANVGEDARKAAVAVYDRLATDDLKIIAASQATVENQQPAPLPNYFGAAGGPAANVKDDSDNILPIPTFNFDDMASPALRKKA